MARKKVLTEQDRLKVVKMYTEEGLKTVEIANAFGVCPATIRDGLAQHGVRFRFRKERFISNAQKQEMKTLYESGLSFQEVADRIGFAWGTVHDCLIRQGVQPRPAGFRSGEDHHAWKGGRIEKDGYVLIRVYPDDPFFCMAVEKEKGASYVLEHRLVMAKKLGRPLTDHETVHHKDTNHQNNAEENLQLRQGKHGRGAAFRCADCGSCNIIGEDLADLH